MVAPVRPVDQQRRRRQLTERPDTGKTAWEDVTAEMEDLRRETEVQRSDLMALENARLDQYAGMDDIPETPKNPVSRVGDIWTLGKHRLMCGDATKPEHRLRHRDRARLR